MTKHTRRLASYLMLVVMLYPTAKADDTEPSLDHTVTDTISEYELGAGDKIHIMVYREPDLTLDTKISDAGTIILPFLGEIPVAGLTLGGLKHKLSEGLNGRYLVDPQVSVSIVEYREFFVNGEVKKPGAFAYMPGLTVHKAVSIAGGFTDRALQSSAQLISGKDQAANVHEVKLDAPVMPGDMVIIEESFF